MDAIDFTVGYREIARPFGAARQHDSVEFSQQFVHGDSDADFDARAEFHAFGCHLLDTAIDQMLFHFEIGNAIAQQSADAIVLLEQGHRMPGACELLRTGQAGGAGADNGHGLAGAMARRLRYDPAFFPSFVDDGAFDRFDRDRRIVDVEGAGRLAWGGADPAGEFREVVGRVQYGQRTPVLLLVD